MNEEQGITQLWMAAEIRAAALTPMSAGTGAKGGREVMKTFVHKLVLESGVCLIADASIFI